MTKQIILWTLSWIGKYPIWKKSNWKGGICFALTLRWICVMDSSLHHVLSFLGNLIMFLKISLPLLPICDCSYYHTSTKNIVTNTVIATFYTPFVIEVEEVNHSVSCIRISFHPWGLVIWHLNIGYGPSTYHFYLIYPPHFHVLQSYNHYFISHPRSHCISTLYPDLFMHILPIIF